MAKRSHNRRQQHKVEKLGFDLRKVKIDTRPSELRTLKQASRRQRRKERESFLGVSHPHYRYKNRQQPKASLLGLPRELRQNILEKTIDEKKLVGHKLGKIKTWIGKLSGVCPLIRIDMTYVGQIWKKKAGQNAVAMKEDVFTWGRRNLYPQVALPRERNSGAMTNRREKKWMRQSKRRPRMCWHCMERHFRREVVCPPAGRDPKFWQRVTKVKPTHNNVPKDEANLFGKRTLFNE
jgi:hypothetical protein